MNMIDSVKIDNPSGSTVEVGFEIKDILSEVIKLYSHRTGHISH